MKSLLFIVLLAVLSVRNVAAVIQDQDDFDTRANLSVGSSSSGDRLLYRSYFSRGAITNTVQNLNVTFRGAASTRITSIRAIEQGASQNARPSITAGGVGRNTVTIRLSSARGRGFYYLVEIRGR